MSNETKKVLWVCGGWLAVFLYIGITYPFVDHVEGEMRVALGLIGILAIALCSFATLLLNDGSAGYSKTKC